MAALLFPSSREAASGGPDAPTLECRGTATPEELASHLAIRATVFVAEQGMFAHDDLDEHDEHDADTQHVLGWVDGMVAGTVRLFPVVSPAPGESLWKGDRLTVLPEFRHSGIGAALVRHAVATAGAAGGDRMTAWIQLSNVNFFRHLGWSLVGGPGLYLGHPHQQVSVSLR